MKTFLPEIDATLKGLLEFATEAGLSEVVWENGSRRVSFKRGAAAFLPEPVVEAPAAETTAIPLLPHQVKSPMVGTFLRAAKDRPPLVLEGSTVAPGQKLAIVEAMNLPKDVVCDMAGRVTKILVENGKPVEYGQPVFEIEPIEATHV